MESGRYATGARSALPLFLRGATRSTARNSGSVIGSVWLRESAGQLGGDLAEEQDLPTASGRGIETHAVAYGLALRGRTDATFSNNFSTENGQARPASDCAGCAPSECIRATGTLVSTFQVATTVTLPSVDDFPNLTPCQRERVRNAITNVLAPHEQQHVSAFRTYSGTVRTPFNLTLCRAAFDARIQSLHDGVEAPRRAAAQAQSDALDPFNFEVDLNCQDRPSSLAPAPRPSRQGATDTGSENPGSQMGGPEARVG
jgi:hypothetical protein